MQILFHIPDDIAHKLDQFCEQRKTSRAELLRTMTCKLLGVPVPPKKPLGRKRQQS